MVIRLNFSRWILGLIASAIAMARSYFPFIFPMFFRMIQLLFISFIILLENNKHENALKKSKNLVGGKEWPLLGIFILPAIPSLVLKACENYIAPDANLVLQIIATTLISIFYSVFLLTFYKMRSQVVSIEYEEQPVIYGKIIKQTLLGGIGGIFWFVFVIMITALVAVLVLKKLKEPADTALISQPAAEQATTASASPTEWIHPINQKVLVLPKGFTVYDLEDDSYSYAAFTTDPDDLLESVMIKEKKPETPDLSSIVDAEYKKHVKNIDPTFKLSKPKMRKVKGLQVAEFAIEDTSEGRTDNLVFRIWTLDNTHYWQVLSSIRASDEKAAQDSERMLEYLIESSLQ